MWDENRAYARGGCEDIYSEPDANGSHFQICSLSNGAFRFSLFPFLFLSLSFFPFPPLTFCIHSHTHSHALATPLTRSLSTRTHTHAHAPVTRHCAVIKLRGRSGGGIDKRMKQGAGLVAVLTTQRPPTVYDRMPNAECLHASIPHTGRVQRFLLPPPLFLLFTPLPSEQ